jgi:hypothetical protein
MSFKQYYLLSEANLGGKSLWERSFRAGILIDKLKELSPLTLGDDTMVTPVKSKANNQLIKDLTAMQNDKMDKETGSKLNIEVVDGQGNQKTITVGKLKKTAEFGGGGGSGAGAEATATFESATCMISAMIQAKGGSSDKLMEKFSKMTPDEWQAEASSVSKYYSCDVEDMKMIDFVTSKADWLKGLVYSCNHLVKSLKGKYVFHRGDALVDMIESNVKAMIKNAGEKININKWSPADIWITKTSFNEGKLSSMLSDLLNKDAGIYNFNSFLVDQLKGKQEVVGVSLKKTKTNPKLDPVNLETASVDYEVDTVEANTPNPSSIGKLYLTKDVYVKDDDDGLNLQIRSFSQRVSDAVQGELKGKSANMGKIGNSGLLGYFKQNNKPLNLTRFSKDKDIIVKNGRDYQLRDEYSEAFLNAIRTINRSKVVKGKINVNNKEDVEVYLKDLMKRNKNDMNKVAGVFASKLQGLEIISKIEKDFIEYAYLYASSKLPISAPYWKLWES